jgi:hypothetical protein
MLVENDEEMLGLFEDGFQNNWKERILQKLTGVYFTKQKKPDVHLAAIEEPEHTRCNVQEAPLPRDSAIGLDFVEPALLDPVELGPDLTMDTTPEPIQQEDTLASAYVKQKEHVKKKRTKKSPAKSGKDSKSLPTAPSKDRPNAKMPVQQERLYVDSTTEDEMMIDKNHRNLEKSDISGGVVVDMVSNSEEDSDDSLLPKNPKKAKAIKVRKKRVEQKPVKRSGFEMSGAVPVTVVGTTRSGRNVLKPLEWWKNEKHAP